MRARCPLILIVAVLSFPAAAQASTTWTEADKDGYGTSTTTTSKVWHTLDDGRLTEVFYPDLGTPSVRSLDFVEATRALGASNRRIITRHLMPNSLAPIIVAATLAVGDFIITESFLSFLGLGIQEPVPSWGNLLQSGQENAAFITTINPMEDIRGFLILFPGFLILLGEWGRVPVWAVLASIAASLVVVVPIALRRPAEPAATTTPAADDLRVPVSA